MTNADIPAMVAELRRRLLTASRPPTGPAACYQFDVDGVGGGTFHIRVDAGYALAGEGPPTAPPDCTIRLDAGTAMGLLTGAVNPVTAYLTGRIKVAGDMAVASRLGDLLR